MRRLLCTKLSQVLTATALLFTMGAVAQTQTKRYSEKFNVDDEVEVAVNTAYTDLVFETWNRNQVEVEAIIEIEGISEKEAEALFAEWDFKAVGNSEKVTVSTGRMIHSNHSPSTVVFREQDDFDFTYEFEIPDVDMIVEMMPQNLEVPPMPPMPPVNFKDMEFDFEAYEKEGDDYLKKWKAEFQEKFDKDKAEEMEEWGKEVAELYKGRREEMKSIKAEMKVAKEMMQRSKEERERLNEEVRRQLRENQAEVRILVEKARKEAQKARANAVTIHRDRGVHVAPGADAKVFFYNNDGKSKNLKIKKTIRIKAPKGAKLDLNVRHGEVKLAENYKNINATLSYSRLHAPLVDGKQTKITAAYSPMRVDHWKEGALYVSYAKALELEKVQNITLDSKSSNVVVGELSGNAIINGSFGDLVISKFGDAFKSLDIVMENSDATLVLPAVAFDIYARTTFSRMNTPSSLNLTENKMQSSNQVKGYNRSAGSGRNIHIIANYSNVNLKGI